MKIFCFLGFIDNVINSEVIMLDLIVIVRNGKIVEIFNIDVEGRLVFGDVFDYVCD